MLTPLDTDSMIADKAHLHYKVGTLEIIAGPMFSGKTTELLRRLKCESAMGFRVMYVNHTHDVRGEHFSTHNELYTTKIEGIDFQAVSRLEQVTDRPEIDIVGIDEAQFFPDLVEEVIKMVEAQGKHVVVAGLNGDFRRNPFGRILELEPKADSYTRLKSYCMDCSKQSVREFALFTFRIAAEKDIVFTGGREEYIPLCRKCYVARERVVMSEGGLS